MEKAISSQQASQLLRSMLLERSLEGDRSCLEILESVAPLVVDGITATLQLLSLNIAPNGPTESPDV